jgi:hypothetical protein
MSKLRLEAEERIEMLAYLDALLDCVKSLHASVAEIMSEVEELRSALFEDADEIAAYKRHLRTTVAPVAFKVEDTVRSYDGLIEEIVSSQQYKN